MIKGSIDVRLPLLSNCRQKKTQAIREAESSGRDEGARSDIIATIHGWLAPEIQNPSYSIVLDYLNERIGVKDASKRIFSPIDERINENKLDDVNFAELWLSILYSARRISYRQSQQHDKLVDLVAAFKNHSISGNEEYNYIYGSLTEFDLCCREVCNNSPNVDSGFINEEADAWANLNFFLARVASKHISDCSRFAIWVMREALEEPQDDDKPARAAEKHNVYVPAAAMWVFGMGRALFMKEEEVLNLDDMHTGNSEEPGDLWKGKRGFSKQRWWFCTSLQCVDSVLNMCTDLLYLF